MLHNKYIKFPPCGRRTPASQAPLMHGRYAAQEQQRFSTQQHLMFGPVRRQALSVLFLISNDHQEYEGLQVPSATVLPRNGANFIIFMIRFLG